jgi:polynucleotide 5'-kinase involved in rRNA processing
MASLNDAYEQALKRQRKRLWTDKYQSKKYLDLMSDDLSNRKCLNWVKSWDDKVFNRDAKVVAPSLTGNRKKNSFFDNTQKKTLEEENTRQNKSVLMLHGTSGVGKSTMARVIARTCGY